MESAEREREQQRQRRAHLKGRVVFVPEMAELSDGSEDKGSSRSDSQLPLSISALWTTHKKATRACWDEEWRRSTVGRQLFAASPITSRSAKYYNGLSRRQATLLCRLRTGPSSLNAHRAIFDSTRDPLCVCGEEEDREHILIACPLYHNACQLLFRHLRPRKPPTTSQLLGNPSYREPVLDFLDRTGRFPRLA
uniref:Reverse transcriptase n=1 Tax=Rhodotorula toruloides TaxID=5286 RepID=A0A0K3C6U9_RHOTO